MVAKSNFLEDAILNHVFRGVAFPTLAANVWVALHTASPTDAGGSEVLVASHAWYARVAVSRATGSWTAPADSAGAQSISNAGVITFANPTTTVAITHVGIHDAATGGNLLYHAALGTTRTVNNGDSAPSFAIGAMVWTEA